MKTTQYQLMKSMTAEYIAYDGYITCEFQVGRPNLSAMRIASRGLPKGFVWRAERCEACRDNNPGKPWHVTIVRKDRK